MPFGARSRNGKAGFSVSRGCSISTGWGISPVRRRLIGAAAKQPAELLAILMIEGSYKRTQDSQIVDGIIEVIPVDGSCAMRLNKFQSWRIDIIPGPMLGDFDLVQRSQSAPWFVGVAKPKPGLVS
jgi:hypothetical protein